MQWRVRDISQRGDFSCVETEPVSAKTEFPRLRFVLARGEAGELRDCGCYCFDGRKWVLLYSTPGTPTGWEALGLGEPPAPAKPDWSAAHPRAAGGCLTLFSLPFVLAGVGLFLVALGLLPPPEKRYAPGFVLPAAGFVFLVPGLALLAGGLRAMATGKFPRPRTHVLEGTIVSAVLGSFALVLAGVAIFGDPRGFYGRTLTGTLVESRLWTGVAALVVGAIAFAFAMLTINAARVARAAGRAPRSDFR